MLVLWSGAWISSTMVWYMKGTPRSDHEGMLAASLKDLKLLLLASPLHEQKKLLLARTGTPWRNCLAAPSKQDSGIFWGPTSTQQRYTG